MSLTNDVLFRDLEKAVEELSQMLEESIEINTVKSLRQRMMDKTVCCFFGSSNYQHTNVDNRSMFEVDMIFSCKILPKVYARVDGSGTSLWTSERRAFPSVSFGFLEFRRSWCIGIVYHVMRRMCRCRLFVLSFSVLLSFDIIQLFFFHPMQGSRG